MADSLPTAQGLSAPAYGGRDFVHLQQELIAVRTRLDRQIAQLTRLNRLSSAMLSQQQARAGLETFAEAIPDVLDMAIGVVWELEDRHVADLAAFGLELEGAVWGELGLALLLQLESGGRRQAIQIEASSQPLLQQHDLCDVMICRCINSDGICVGLVMAANTTSLAGMFDPISEDCLMVLTQVAERFAGHLDNRRYHHLLDERLQELRDSEERLQRVLRGTNDGWWEWDLGSDTCLVSSRWVDMLGGSGDQARRLRGFWFGRVHPADREAFEHALRRVLEAGAEATLEQEVDLVRDDGSSLPVLVRGNASRAADGRAIRVSGTILDLTERRRHEAHVHRLAYYDSLTDLTNRRGLLEELPRTIAACQAANNRLALLMIDLDRFKTLNDSYGHAAGDQMLHLVAHRLRQGVRSHDLVARLGGDEFVVVCDRIGTDLETAQDVALKVARGLLLRLSRPYELKVGTSHHSASIGVAVLDRRSATAEDLLQHADVALYEAKSGGRSMVRLFDPDMQLQVSQRATLEKQLRHAIDRQELDLHYHGIVDGDGCICGAEALLRWPVQDRPWIPPDRFIPIAEESGLIHGLGVWSLQHIADLLQRWQGLMDDHFRISLNLSASQFLHPDFVERMLGCLADFSIDSRRLMLEITEATVLDDLGKAAERMNRLRDHGLEFSLDDFGTGYSSISYLCQLPLAEVKIDKIYVRDFLTNQRDAAVLRAVLSLCQSLQITVVAEGIETEEQWQQLRADGCHRFQGFLFSTPRQPGPDPSSLLRSRWRAAPAAAAPA